MAALQELGALGAGRNRATKTGRLHALLDGMVVQLLAGPARLTPGRARDILARHLADLTT